MELFFAIGVAQGIFLIVFLLFKKENQLANRLLAFLIFLISFSLFLNYVYSTDLIQRFPHLIGLDNANPFLIPPIIFFYAKVLTSKEFEFKAKDAYHLLPFGFYFLYVLFNFFVKDASYKIEYLENLKNIGMPLDLVISSMMKIIQAIVYMLTTLLLLRTHASTIKNEFSYTEKIGLSWLRIVTISITVIYSIRFIGILLPIFFSQLNPGFIEGIMELVNVIFIYLMAYFGLTQPEIFRKWRKQTDKMSTSQNKNNAGITQNPKYITSILSETQSQQILRDLEEYMTEEKPYLLSELTIRDIANALGVHSKSLSQVINEQLKLNFFNFVNKYRVEEVKSKLEDVNFSHYSILGIALDSGFSSKSTFNSTFKKFTGSTPSDYRSANS